MLSYKLNKWLLMWVKINENVPPPPLVVMCWSDTRVWKNLSVCTCCIRTERERASTFAHLDPTALQLARVNKLWLHSPSAPTRNAWDWTPNWIPHWWRRWCTTSFPRSSREEERGPWKRGCRGVVSTLTSPRFRLSIVWLAIARLLHSRSVDHAKRW